MSPIVEITGLSKTFSKRKAVDNVSLTIEQGEIFGLIGPNGAGKTTTMNMLVTLLTPDQGTIRVGGYLLSQSPREIRRLIGFMPDSFGVYGNMTVSEYLDFFGACYKIPPAQRKRLITDLLELVDLTHRQDDMVDKLSRGLKQRLALARVLIHDPELLVLDEPASGLDPRARVEIRALLQEIASLGKTILFSSHILSDVSELCSRLAIMEDGRIITVGALDQLDQAAANRRQLNIKLLGQAGLQPLKEYLENRPGVSNLRDQNGLAHSSRTSVEFEFQGDDQEILHLLQELIEQELPVIHFSVQDRNLEDVFMSTTQGIVS
ncbi:MAG: ABC transporter ATP-binding protein [Anaerolineales bacterium]|nr:ABC transporter ATP-binding protein [Anaerolineales bacterium]